MTSLLLGLLLLQPADTGAPDIRLAQTFKVRSGESPEDPARPDAPKPKQKPKTPKPPKAPATEDDLFSEEPADGTPAAGPKKKPAESDVEEISPDEVGEPDSANDESGDDTPAEPGKPAQPPDDEMGGWGGKVERDRWGDEEERKRANAPLPGTAPDAGPARIQADAGSVPDAGSVLAGADATPGDGMPDGGTVAAPAGFPPAAEDGTQAIRPPSGTFADLKMLWEKRRLHLEQRDFSLAEADLEAYRRLKEELGVKNATLPALALIREAQTARQRQDQEGAQKLLEAAVALAPDLGAAHRSRAAFWFADNPLKIGRVADELWVAVRAAFSDPIARYRVFGNTALAVWLGLLLAGAAWLLVLFLWRLPLLFHDFHHLFPRGVARVQTGLLLVLLLALPIIFRAGLMLWLLGWTVASFLYQERKERVLTLLVVVLLGVSPFVMEWSFKALSSRASTAVDVLAIQDDLPAGPSLERLRSRLLEVPEQPALLAALAGHAKRGGDLPAARDLFERALAAQPNSATILNNLGNVHFLLGELDRALELYRRAIQQQPDAVEPYANLSRLYFRRLDLNKGREAHQQAQRLNAEAARRISEAAQSGRANHVVADMPLPEAWVSSLLQDGVSPPRIQAAVDGLWRRVGGFATPGVFPWLALGYLALLVLLWPLSARMALSRPCLRCGRAACRRCNAELRDDTYCGPCYHAFVKKEQVDARARISKEIEIRQFRRRQTHLSRGLSFLLPGAGQVLRDRPIRGFLFLNLAACLAAALVLGDGPVRSALPAEAGVDWWRLLLLLVPLAGIYLWAILDVFFSENP